MTSVLTAEVPSAYGFPMKSRLGSNSMSPVRSSAKKFENEPPTCTVNPDASDGTVIPMKIQAGMVNVKVRVSTVRAAIVNLQLMFIKCNDTNSRE